jgi:hypothetical protein
MHFDAVPITAPEPPKSSRLPAFLFHSPLVVRSQLQVAFEDVWDLEPVAGMGDPSPKVLTSRAHGSPGIPPSSLHESLG